MRELGQLLGLFSVKRNSSFLQSCVTTHTTSTYLEQLQNTTLVVVKEHIIFFFIVIGERVRSLECCSSEIKKHNDEFRRKNRTKGFQRRCGILETIY